MRSLRISVLGGTGFVGSALVTRLIRDGHRVQVLTRNRARHRALTVLPGLELLQTDVHDPSALAEAFRGSDVVINLIGVLNERGRASFQRVHVDLTRKMIQASRSAGVPRVLQMSSLGASASAPSRYLRSKAAAEQALREDAGPVAWTVLRPSIVIGPDGGLLHQFATLLAAFPVLPLARGGARLAPVLLDDLVAALIAALDAPGIEGATLELCGPEVFSLTELARYIATASGHRRWVFGLPAPLGWLQAAVLGLLPGSPLSLDNFRSLGVDSVCTENGFGRLGLTVTGPKAAVPGYLGAGQPAVRYAQYRRAAGIRIDEP
jgi:NADH dehydrogenase